MYNLDIVQHNIEVTQMNGHVVPKMDMFHQHKNFYHEQYVNNHKLICVLVLWLSDVLFLM
jgi:hypothetical protein